jgi:lipopolysaccharide cholinephosphotransferase
LSQGELRALRETQLELLNVLHELCEGLGIRYYAIAGTALGAVRHHGFIPWDDDLDVAMSRADFDRLVSIAPGKLDHRYFLQHHTTDPNFPLAMAKMRRNDSMFVEPASAAARVHQGIFIDIFPIDRKPQLPWLRRAHGAIVSSLSRVARARSGYQLRPGGPRAVRMIIQGLGRAVPMKLLTSGRDIALRLFRTGRGPLTIASGTYGYSREWFAESWLQDEAVIVPFEDRTIPVFADHSAYLQHLYGDYLRLPPPHQRVSPHNVSRLEFPPPAHGSR